MNWQERYNEAVNTAQGRRTYPSLSASRSLTVEFPAGSVTPRLYRLLTGIRMPLRARMSYYRYRTASYATQMLRYARKSLYRLSRIFHRNTSS